MFQALQGKKMIPAHNGKMMEAKTVFVRILQYIYKNAETDISAAAGISLRMDEVKWVLTVPAAWGDRAKQFMKEAAKEVRLRKDFCKVHLVHGVF